MLKWSKNINLVQSCGHVSNIIEGQSRDIGDTITFPILQGLDSPNSLPHPLPHRRLFISTIIAGSRYFIARMADDLAKLCLNFKACFGNPHSGSPQFVHSDFFLTNRCTATILSDSSHLNCICSSSLCLVSGPPAYATKAIPTRRVRILLPDGLQHQHCQPTHSCRQRLRNI